MGMFCFELASHEARAVSGDSEAKDDFEVVPGTLQGTNEQSERESTTFERVVNQL
jgi:hypothetical protein